MAAGKLNDGAVWIDWDPAGGTIWDGEVSEQGMALLYPTGAPGGGARWEWSEDNQRYERTRTLADGSYWVNWMQPDTGTGGVQSGGDLYTAQHVHVRASGTNSGTYQQ